MILRPWILTSLAGYVWFDFSDRGTLPPEFKTSFFLLTTLQVNYPGTRVQSFCDAGLAEQTNNRVWGPRKSKTA